MTLGMSCLTLTHSPIISECVAGWAGALVSPKCIDAAERTEQKVLRTFIYICTTDKISQSNQVAQKAVYCGKIQMHSNGRMNSVSPSHVIIGPGSNPSSQLHSKLPITLAQDPFPHGFPTAHSSTSA